jgi:Host cell surface-exposed lipoprotein
MLKKIGITLAVLFGIGLVLSMIVPPPSTTVAENPQKQDINPAQDTKLANTDTQVLEEDAASESLTAPQKNALRSAEQYLSMSGFSKKGLIAQLSADAGEGYAVADATAAVNSLTVDWNENAAKSAQQYLQMSGFSCKGLIQQLSSNSGDKYTVDEATYGAKKAGAC